jgi:hypothetical protein
MITARAKHSKYLSDEEQDAVRAYIRDRLLPSYTQTEVSAQLEISRSSLNRIIKGLQVVMPSLVMTISKITGDGIPEITGLSPGRRAPTLGQLPGYLESERMLRDSQTVVEDAAFWLNLRDVTVPSAQEVKSISPDDVFACVQFLRGLRKKVK